MSDVDGVCSMASGSSSSRVCSGLSGVRVGGAGSFRAFDLRFRNRSGPNPLAANKNQQIVL